MSSPRRLAPWLVLAALIAVGGATAVLWNSDSPPDTIWISRNPVTRHLEFRLDPNGPIDGPWRVLSRVDEVPGEFVFLERRQPTSFKRLVLRWRGLEEKVIIIESVGYRRKSPAALSSGAQEYRRIPDDESETDDAASDGRR